jgi:hypothetical protein
VVTRSISSLLLPMCFARRFTCAEQRQATNTDGQQPETVPSRAAYAERRQAISANEHHDNGRGSPSGQSSGRQQSRTTCNDHGRTP